jgi:hypothetical protein
MGGGKGKASAPPPIDPGKSMGEYLFGQGFSSYQGITDPRLQERLLGAEATYRPQYTALELADIGVMARGLGNVRLLILDILKPKTVSVDFKQN